MYRAILFDLDDTLYDLYTYRTGRLQRALVDIFATYTHLDHDALIHASVTEHVFMRQLPDFLRRRGIEDEALIAAACDVYERGWFEEMELADDAVHTLQELRKRFKLGLVTNGPSWSQRPKIERFGLAALMDVLVVSEEVGVAKPDPTIFRIALERLGITPAEALFVGDSPEHDLRGAAAVGMPCIWIDRHNKPLPNDVPPPMKRITRLAELPPLLEQLCI
jgi:putative hydrolase of the HAD superfamily